MPYQPWTKEKAAKDYEKQKLCAARWCWRRKYEYVPNAKITWEEWFEKIFKEPLHSYAARKIKEKSDGENYQK